MSTTPSQISEEVYELKGRLTAFMVNFPEVEGRTRNIVTLLNDLQKNPSHPGLMLFVTNELLTYWAQLHRVFERFPELRKELTPILGLLEGLLSTE